MHSRRSQRWMAAGIAFGLLSATAYGQPPEVGFDAERGHVTVRLSPSHLQDVRIPFPLRQRLTVQENGVRQPDVQVEVEQTPITIAVLIENGGRSHQLNESVTGDAAMLTRPLLDVLDERDRLGVFAYDDTLRTVVDFDTPREQWSVALGRLPKPRFSEANFHDATLSLLDRMSGMPGRKAIWVLSTGIDTFSRATFDQVLARTRSADVPVYVMNLGELARRRLSSMASGPLARVDWRACERQLDQLARVSGGRAYLNATSLDVDSIYDEIVNELKVRYVLSYAPRPGPPAQQRVVQVGVLGSSPGDPARQVAERRAREGLQVIAEAVYTPGIDVGLALARSEPDRPDGP